jgi:hypothetical protein
MSKYMLIKFGAKEHMEAFMDYGEVYMQTLGYYSNLEDRERGDKYEGIVKLHSSNGGVLKLKDRKNEESYSIDLTYIQMRTRDSSLQSVNVYCLYLIQLDDSDSFEFGAKISVDVVNGFGDTAVLIYDVEEFLHRVVNAAEDKNFSVVHRIVKYLNLRDYTGDLGPFKKDITFSHQCEYRIAVGRHERDNKPVKLNIGPLDGVAIMIKASDVQSLNICFSDE